MIEKLKKFYTRGAIFKSYIEGNDILPIVVKLKRITQKDIAQNFTANEAPRPKGRGIFISPGLIVLDKV